MKAGPAYGYSYSAGRFGHIRASDLNKLVEAGVVELAPKAGEAEKADSKTAGAAETATATSKRKKKK